jgi:multidrug resistance efflux pump
VNPGALSRTWTGQSRDGQYLEKHEARSFITCWCTHLRGCHVTRLDTSRLNSTLALLSPAQICLIERHLAVLPLRRSICNKVDQILAESQLTLSQAKLKSVLAQHEQARHAVTTLEPLINQRGAKAAAVKNAQYQLNNCRVYAPFDGIVTNLTISEGAYAHVGQEMFTLIDARTWWAIGNFREGLLGRISPGMKADVYVMSRPDVRFSAVVDSVGFGVTPDPDRIGNLSRGLPDIQRTLNWVHLASRYPVRVRVENPTGGLFRLGESAVVTIRGH